MRCREARYRIDLLVKSESKGRPDTDLQKHLEGCESCAEYAELCGRLESAFASARSDDAADLIPIDQQRHHVERRLAAKHERPRRPVILSPFSPLRPLLGRPGVRWGVSVAAVVLLAVTFVPFTHYRTIGYDLSVDGVSRDLALDNERICDLLTRMGLVEAGVEVIGCDTTCLVSILDLKTEREVHLVVGAITSLNEAGLTANIVPIRAKSSRTLIEQANDLIRHGET